MLLTLLNLNAVPSIPQPQLQSANAFDYTGLELKVTELIVKFGRTMTFRRVSKAPTDELKPWQGSTTLNTDTNVTAVFLDYDVRDIDLGLVQRGDQRVLIRGNVGIDVTDQDFVLDGTNEWSINNVNTLNPGGVVMLYDCQLRK